MITLSGWRSVKVALALVPWGIPSILIPSSTQILRHVGKDSR